MPQKSTVLVNPQSPVKERVIAAARQLMQQDGNADFSMRALSELAKVSSATPYNVFGSKSDIVAAVVDDDMRRLERALMEIEASPLDAIFRLVDVVAEIFAEAPDLYRAGARLLTTAQAQADDAANAQFYGQRFLVLRALLGDAVQAGVISHKVNLDTFTVNFGQQILSWILMWANGQFPLEEMRLRIHYAVGFTLAGAATPDHRTDLEQRMLRTQGNLRRLDRKRLMTSL